MDIPNEHLKHDTFTEQVFYPEHPPSTESATFLHTKHAGHAAKLPCSISGHAEGTEYHHFFVEWAFADAVDWVVVKGVALGQITRLPVLDPHTDQPTGETFPAEQSLIFIITKLTAARGFDWSAFDPARPELFVDSMANMLVLHSKSHRLEGHAIHGMSFPEWIFYAWSRKAGFVFTPDEEAAP